MSGFVPWPLPRERERAKRNTLDPSTWGPECARGFVSDARFGPSDRVIPRTNRDVTRKWRRSSPEKP
jgi:hypothetical protein